MQQSGRIRVRCPIAVINPNILQLLAVWLNLQSFLRK
jgi:hypothetical protein